MVGNMESEFSCQDVRIPSGNSPLPSVDSGVAVGAVAGRLLRDLRA